MTTKLELIKQYLKQNPDYSDEELAILVGTTPGYVRKVKWLLDKEHNNNPNPSSKFNQKEYIIRLESELKRTQVEKRYYKRKYEEALNTYSKIDDILFEIIDKIQIFQPDQYHLKLSQVQHNTDLEAVLLLSDIHVGEVVDLPFNRYNTDICRDRLSTVLSKTIQKVKSHNITTLWIFLLGDIVSGNLHQDLLTTNEVCVAEQVIISANLISNFIYELSRHVKSVNVACVPGNHGRITKEKTFKEIINNFDYLSYRLIEAYLKNIPNVNMNISRHLYMIVTIQEYNFFLSHGDTIKTWLGIPYYGIERYSSNIKRIHSNFDSHIHCIVHGHFHVPSVNINSNKDCRIINGTLKGTDEYSLAKSYYCDPCQVLFTVSKYNIVEDLYLLWC